MTTISLRLPDALLKLLEQTAKSRRVSKTRVVRESLEQTLKARSKKGFVSCYDLSRHLIGSIKGPVPKDLATNPKYMEGFGR